MAHALGIRDAIWLSKPLNYDLLRNALALGSNASPAWQRRNCAIKLEAAHVKLARARRLHQVSHDGLAGGPGGGREGIYPQRSGVPGLMRLADPNRNSRSMQNLLAIRLGDFTCRFFRSAQ
jgi:hypothetical protein